MTAEDTQVNYQSEGRRRGGGKQLLSSEMTVEEVVRQTASWEAVTLRGQDGYR